MIQTDLTLCIKKICFMIRLRCGFDKIAKRLDCHNCAASW